MTSIPSLESITLDKGSHSNRDDGMCIMEAVSWIAGEPWSERPTCASPVVATFLLNWNDALPDDTRQSLRQYILPLIGSRGTDEQELRRSWMACDWLVRTFTVRWLRLAKLEERAAALESLPELTTAALANAALPIITAARDAAWAAAWAAARDAARDAAWAAAWAAAGDAAWDAARDAARDAAWAAAWAAARDAAWAAAGDAARAAARDAAWAAAWAAARDAAWAAAGDAARAAARAAARDAAWAAARAAARDAAWAAAGDAARAAARDAAWAAAGDALAPTVRDLQESAHALVRRMLEVTP